MTQFNILGKGFLDMEDPQGIGFKAKNPWFCFADVELGRSTEFAIPANNHNRLLLGFGEDPAEYGDDLRYKHDCQMVYDGGLRNGTLTVTAYDGDSFKCVFVTDNAAWIDRLQGMKLSEVPIGDNHVVWDTTAPVVDANAATPTPSDFVKILKYDNGGVSGAWQLVPSVHVVDFVRAILTALDVPYNPLLVQADISHWLVAGSLKNGATDSVTLQHVNTTTASITQTMGLLSLTNQYLKSAEALIFGAYIGGTNTPAQMFRAENDIKMTFGVVPSDVYLIKWDVSLKKCRCLGGYPSGSLPSWVITPMEMLGDVGTDLTGKTIEFAKGDTFFFSDYFGNIITSNYFTNQQIIPGEGYFGWKDVAHPFSVSATVSVDDELELGETWWLRYNMPDMTVFEFLKSVALSSAMEMTVTPSEFSLMQGFYGEWLGVQYFKPLDKVLSVDRVERKAWGDARHAFVKFDSEEYVTEKVTTDYEVPNANLTEAEDHVVKFSEGALGNNGVLIKDVSSSPIKFTAKKWTLARVDAAAAHPDYLQRVEAPSAVGYDDIAANSTCLSLKAVMTFADFMDMKPMDVFLWRGMAYVWTDASWSQGISTMTMQRVSALKAGQ